MHCHLPIILRFSLSFLIALLTMSERVSKRSGSDSLLMPSASHSQPSSSSSSSASSLTRNQEVYQLRARQFIADHGKSPREDVIQALLADPTVFLHCAVADARTIWGYIGMTTIAPNQHNRKDCIAVLRQVWRGKDEVKLDDDNGDEPGTPPSASSSDQQPEVSESGRRSSLRQRVRQEASEPLFDACIRLHARGDPIPSEFLGLLTSQQRTILIERGVLDPETGDTAKRRRSVTAKSSRSGAAASSDRTDSIIRDRPPKSIPRGLPLVASYSLSSPSDPEDSSSDSSSSSSTVDTSSPSSESSSSRRRRHRRRRHAAKRHKLSSVHHQLVSSASECPKPVRKYFEAHGSASRHSYTGEVERMLATQTPTQFWFNFCATLSKDRRSQNEGLVLAMALEVVQYPVILTELLSRRLFGLWHFLRNDDWDLANALLPLGGASLLNAKVQQELNTHKRRAAKVLEHRTSASRSFRSNRYGAGRRHKGNDAQHSQHGTGRDESRDRRVPPRHSASPSSSASAPHRRQSGAAPTQNDQRSSAAGGSGAGHT